MEIRRFAFRPAPEQSRPRLAANAGDPVSCTRCGGCYDTDPTLLVACPTCSAIPGQPCCKPADGGVRQSHLSRGRQALGSGRMRPCGALTWDGLHAFAVPAQAPFDRDGIGH